MNRKRTGRNETVCAALAVALLVTVAVTPAAAQGPSGAGAQPRSVIVDTDAGPDDLINVPFTLLASPFSVRVQIRFCVRSSVFAVRVRLKADNMYAHSGEVLTWHFREVRSVRLQPDQESNSEQGTENREPGTEREHEPRRQQREV